MGVAGRAALHLRLVDTVGDRQRCCENRRAADDGDLVYTALAIARQCANERGVDEIAVIGGTSVFAAALPIADRIYKTEVHGSPVGDAYFPTVDWEDWREVAREALPRGPNDDFSATLIELRRR
jgi:dihydrofolate reductase